MPTIDFERLDWEDYPSTETPLSAENLNRLEDAMEGIYDDVGGQEQAISNILGNFAYVEPTSTASKDYLAGDLLVRGDYMYKAIIPIQTDDALVEGTNITKTTVSSELGVDVFSNFAYIERSNVATKNYTVGSHVLLNNILYVVTSAVETGENLVVDMNIEQTTVCDELEKETGSVASAVGYDNTTSGLTATNVQDAVDELASPAAEGVSYDNTESGLTATNVQDAVDEVCSMPVKRQLRTCTCTSGGVFSTVVVHAYATSDFVCVFGYFSNSSNSSGLIVTVSNINVLDANQLAIPCQSDDNSVKFISLTNSGNDLQILVSQTLTANKYCRFEATLPIMGG